MTEEKAKLFLRILFLANEGLHVIVERKDEDETDEMEV